MAIPRVFISSTCYDLKYIRENVKYFVKTLGYDPVLSEEGSVFYDPTLDTKDSCLREIPSCQMFVLIIGGRFGGVYKDTGKSITNNEYKEAVKSKIPVFALVDNSVLSKYDVYQSNKNNKKVNVKEIDYASVDSTKIFDFIEEVRGNSVNNALVPFGDFSDIESYLKQQWAGMMFSFLTRQNEDKRVADTLAALKQVSDKVEVLSTLILKSVGTDEAKLMNELYDVTNSYLFGFQGTDNEPFLQKLLHSMKNKITPLELLMNKSLADYLKQTVIKLNIGKIVNGWSIEINTRDAKPTKVEISTSIYEKANKDYLELQKKLTEILSKNNVSLKALLKQEGNHAA